MKNKPRAFHIPMSRRRLLQTLTLATSGLLTRGAFAEALTLTPKQTKGPFFPDQLPLDQDNDLVRISDHLKPSVGTVIQLGGRLLSATGAPIRGALIELWQADDRGNYLHTRGESNAPRNLDFQGYGKFESAADGA
jgi:protocatechuate 3,4-dioxygenase beta subunit